MNGTSKKLKSSRASPIWLGGVVLGQKIPEKTSTGLGRPIETEEQYRAETIITVSNHIHCPLFHQQ